MANDAHTQEKATAYVRDLLTEIANSFTDHPGHFAVSSVRIDDGHCEFVLRASGLVYQMFLGPNGRTARSLEVVVAALGRKYKQKFTLVIEETTDSPSSA